jgi:hypothetical protein
MKRACFILVSTLLCSCAPHRESGDGTDSERLPILDRANPIVQRTVAIMEERARESEIREYLRAKGLRVCEEGENGTSWQEDCDTCWCEWGRRYCDGVICPPTPEQLELQRLEFEKEEEMQRAAGKRVCEKGEYVELRDVDCNTCRCSPSARSCKQLVCDKPDRPERKKASTKKTRQ